MGCRSAIDIAAGPSCSQKQRTSFATSKRQVQSASTLTEQESADIPTKHAV